MTIKITKEEFNLSEKDISVKEFIDFEKKKMYAIGFNKIGTKGKTTWWFVFFKIPTKLNGGKFFSSQP